MTDLAVGDTWGSAAEASLHSDDVHSHSVGWDRNVVAVAGACRKAELGDTNSWVDLSTGRSDCHSSLDWAAAASCPGPGHTVDAVETSTAEVSMLCSSGHSKDSNGERWTRSLDLMATEMERNRLANVAVAMRHCSKEDRDHRHCCHADSCSMSKEEHSKERDCSSEHDTLGEGSFEPSDPRSEAELTLFRRGNRSTHGIGLHHRVPLNNPHLHLSFPLLEKRLPSSSVAAVVVVVVGWK